MQKSSIKYLQTKFSSKFKRSYIMIELMVFQECMVVYVGRSYSEAGPEAKM
jgi:hypothetical protein